MDRRGRIDARHQIRRARRHEGAEWREIGAEIGDDRDAQAEEAAVVSKCKLGARDVIAALIVGNEALGAVLLPLHRPFQLAAGPDHQRLLGIDEGLHAEPAADVGRDQAELVFGNLENDFGERVAGEMRTLRRGVQRRAAAGRIVVADGVARFHRVDDNAIVDEFKRDLVCGLGEGGVGCLGVAGVIVPIEHQVAGNMIEKLSRAGRHRILRLGDGRQSRVFDLDRLGGIPRRRQSLGNDQGNGLTHVADLADRKHRTRRVVPRLAVATDKRRCAGYIAEAIRPNVPAGEHQQHARHAPGRGHIDAFDGGVRHRRAQHEGLRHPRQRDVVGVTALPGEKAHILVAPHGLADAELHIVASHALKWDGTV